MAFTDLRSFIEYLEEHEQLKRIKAEVDADLEISAITDRVSKSPAAGVNPVLPTDPYHGNDGGHALVFENVKGATCPCAINLFGSYERMQASLGVTDFQELADKIQELVKPQVPTSFMDKVKKLPDLARLAGMTPKMVRGGICQQVINTENVNLQELPIIKCWPHDGECGYAGKPKDAPAGTGRFITLGGIHTKHPETGERNVGMYRMQVLDEKSTAMHWHMHHDGARYFRMYKERGEKRMPAAVVLGGEPVLTYAATCPLPPDVSELLFAGLLNGKGIELVPCKTIPIDVPANAEIVIEGWVDTEKTVWEGPFGDHTGFYSLSDKYPVFNVTAITHRRNPVYPTTIVGRLPQEDYYLGKATERIFLPLLKVLIPDVIDYHLPMFGAFHNFVFVKIRKEYPMQARKVINSIWGAGQMMFTKFVIVVDEEVDVHDEQEVMFHLGANVDPRRDIMLTDGPVDILDHASPYYGTGSKMGIDATRKIPGEGIVREFPDMLKMTPEIEKLVNRRWSEYGL